MRVVMLNVAFNSTILLSVVMLTFIILSVVILNAFMRNVVAPLFELHCFILPIDSGTPTSQMTVRLL
jgi:hypothetical protein